MSRLTTNKAVAEMHTLELAHNSCYIDENGNARYRDFEMDIDARDMTRMLYERYANITLSEDAEELDEALLDDLNFTAKEDIAGLLALFYRNLWAMAELRERLKYYEDLEDAGRLLELPCRVGDKAYHIIEDRMAEPSIYISVHEIKDVSAKAVYFADDWWTFEEMPELNAFLSKEEAEKALEKLK